MHPLLYLIDLALALYGWVLLAYIILIWLIYFEIVNRHQPFVAKVNEILCRLTGPLLKKVRKFMPDLGGVDISPIAVFIAISVIRYTLYYYAFR